MFEEIDFSPGKVTYNPYKLSPDDMTDIKWLSQDMLQVEYPNGYLLDVGWYGKSFTLNGLFIIRLVKDCNWEKPIFEHEYKSVTTVYEGMKEITKKINRIMVSRQSESCFLFRDCSNFI